MPPWVRILPGGPYTTMILFFSKKEWLQWHGWVPSGWHYALPACNGHDIEYFDTIRWSQKYLDVTNVCQEEAVRIQKFLNKKQKACSVCNGSFKL